MAYFRVGAVDSRSLAVVGAGSCGPASLPGAMMLAPVRTPGLGGTSGCELMCLGLTQAGSHKDTPLPPALLLGKAPAMARPRSFFCLREEPQVNCLEDNCWRLRVALMKPGIPHCPCGNLHDGPCSKIKRLVALGDQTNPMTPSPGNEEVRALCLAGCR